VNDNVNLPVFVVSKCVIDRFMEKVLVPYGLPDACWMWMGNSGNHGYGRVMFDGIRMSAHHWSYLLFVDDVIEESLVVMHACDNRLCVNPAHLSKGTQKDNVRDMMNKGRHANQIKMFCPVGHEYNESNTYYRKGQNGGPRKRVCLVCKKEGDRINARRYLARKKETA
jgi:hypothetical protein